MKQLTQPDNLDVENDILSAEQLREVTATEAELEKRAELSFMEGLMTSMVQVATGNGAKSYEAFIPEKPQPNQQKTIDTVTNKLKDLGYLVTFQPSYIMNEGKQVPMQKMIVNWENNGDSIVSNGPENQ